MTTEERILQFHQSLLTAKTVAEQKRVLSHAIEPLGYNRFLFGIVLGLELDKPRELLIIDHSEGTWRADYVAQRLYRNDPTVRHCMHSDVPLRWDHLFDGNAGLELTAQEREFVATARAAGYRWGITVPVSMAWSPLRFGMSYAIEPGDLSDELIEQKRQSFPHDAHVLTTISTLFAAHINVRQWIIDHYQISDTTIAIYTELSRGKMRKEVAENLGLSIPGVKYHIDQLKEKFEVADWGRALSLFCLLGIPDYQRFFVSK